MSTVAPYVIGSLGGWLVLSALGTCAWSTIAGRLKRRRAPQQETVTVQRVLPPVPPTRSELAWLRDQPVQVLTGMDLQWRFDDVISGARRAEQADQ